MKLLLEKNNQEFVQNTDLVNKIFKKIKDLDIEKKLGKSQIEQIISLSSRIFPTLVNQSSNSEYFDFCTAHLNMGNVFSYLKNAKEANSETDVKKCLDYISQETGVKILVNEDSSLTIEIDDPKIPWNEFSKGITNLSKIFDGHLVLLFVPNNTAKISDIIQFIETNGRLITLLYLKRLNDQIDDAFMEKTIKSCTNLCHLIIKSKKIEGKGLEALSSLKNLTSLDLSYCRGLKKLPAALPAGLIALNLSSCTGLKELPKAWPAGLTSLDLSSCTGLKELPAALPAGLIALDLSGCTDLSEDARFAALSSVLDQNFVMGLELLNSINIKDKVKISSLLVNKLEQKLANPATTPDELLVLANYIYSNSQVLGLHEEHPLMQEAITIKSINEQPGLKNPFSLYKKLKDLFQIASDFMPPEMSVEGVDVRVNMDTLKSLSQGLKIKRTDLPKIVTIESFDKLFNDLKNKVDHDGEAAGIALNNLGTNWATIQMPISGDPTQYLRGLLKLSGEIVSETEAKWRAVLGNILEKDNNKRENNFFTEQEEGFIKTMIGIQGCQGGNEAGIALSYEWLDSKYRYPVKLSKALSVMEAETEGKKIKGITLIKEFVNSQAPDASQEVLAENLVKFVNADLRNQSINITPWIEDESFWDDESYELNKAGALELLKIEKSEEAKNLFSQLIGQTIQKLMESQFSGTNALMEELTGTNAIQQGAHQAIYLKNLIGHLVGVSQAVTFDRHTGTLYDNLINKSREEVLSTFFKYVTPEMMVNDVARSLKDPANETKDALKSFLPEGKYWDENGTLSKLGALELLIILNYVTP